METRSRLIKVESGLAPKTSAEDQLWKSTARDGVLRLRDWFLTKHDGDHVKRTRCLCIKFYFTKASRRLGCWSANEVSIRGCGWGEAAGWR